MTNVKLGLSDWNRSVAREAPIPVQNRYFEQNPTNQVEGSSLLLRPGLKRWLSVGTGPIRGLYSQPGSFNTCLFAASGSELYRADSDNSTTLIGTGLVGAAIKSYVSMAATGNIGSTPEYLFVADGSALYLYMADSYEFATLSGTVANGDGVTMGPGAAQVYYQWTSGSVDAGTPAGTSTDPWLIFIGDSASGPFENLALALTNEGTPGATYSTALTENPNVTYQSYEDLTSSGSLTVRSLDTTTVLIFTATGANIAWTLPTEIGVPSFTQVQVPDNLGIVSVCYIGSFVICVAAGDINKGRFFWIEPGETIIRPLNFATAETEPDTVYSVRAVGDQFWLMGPDSTEPWYPTGDSSIPFARIQGQAYSRGVWQGSDVQVKENLFLVDTEGAVFNVASGFNRISNPAIEQQIRQAIMKQAGT